ncbi:hypothetical protein CAC42_2244 [Sphaceloma murrayae]|uniref:Uncharacterized protein n=1 Tax=Sphaceloma murrayae TaxID=2082308 RepID=A0A2K1QIM9_9PEZI|nr:hypothetical protein CAC42_2244 [Sphaceloma murrayae]
MASKRRVGAEAPTYPTPKRPRINAQSPDSAREGEHEDAGLHTNETNVAKFTRDEKSSKLTAWGHQMQAKITADGAHLNDLIDNLEERRVVSFGKYKAELESLRSLISHSSSDTREPAKQTSGSSSPQGADLQTQTHALLATCTAFIALHNKTRTTLQSLRHSIRAADPPHPCTKSLASARNDMQHLLRAGRTVTRHKMARLMDADISVFEDDDNDDGAVQNELGQAASSGREQSGRVRLMNGMSVHDYEEGVGKENIPPRSHITSRGRNADPGQNMSSRAEEAWRNAVPAAESDGDPRLRSGPEVDMSIAETIKEMEKGVRRLARCLPVDDYGRS